MKKYFGIAGAALISAVLLTQSLFAAVGDIKVNTDGVTAAPAQDGKISTGEYGSASPLILDGSGKNTEGTWANTKWGTQKFTVYSAWDSKNLYIGVTVEGDTTDNQSGCPKIGEDADPFGKCDSFQIGFNPGSIIKGQIPVLFGFGLSADGNTYIRADAYRSIKDGEQTIAYNGKFKAYNTKYSASGVNYVFETAIPWSEICVNGAGRSSEGAKVVDLTGELKNIKAGYQVPFFFVYTDKDASGANIYIRTDATTGAKWVAEEMGSIALVLQAAPKAVEATASAKTADPVFASLVILSISATSAYIFLKKRI